MNKRGAGEKGAVSNLEQDSRKLQESEIGGKGSGTVELTRYSNKKKEKAEGRAPLYRGGGRSSS